MALAKGPFSKGPLENGPELQCVGQLQAYLGHTMHGHERPHRLPLGPIWPKSALSFTVMRHCEQTLIVIPQHVGCTQTLIHLNILPANCAASMLSAHTNPGSCVPKQA